MKKSRVLFISQEISPYLPESEISTISRNLPQQVQDYENEIRTFMPRYGCINERRHQLHEVIRLSGMNLIIDDTDHPLIIKVASIPQARMQVYFIDNEEYFQRKAFHYDTNKKFFKDNDERSIFFCRGVLETIQKLGWTPDIIHCHGWMTALIPAYIKNMYSDNPVLSDAKIIYSTYDSPFKGSLDKRFIEKASNEELTKEHLKVISDPTYNNVNKLGMEWADGVIAASETLDDDLNSFMDSLDKPVLKYPGEEYVDAYCEFYELVNENNSVLVD